MAIPTRDNGIIKLRSVGLTFWKRKKEKFEIAKDSKEFQSQNSKKFN